MMSIEGIRRFLEEEYAKDPKATVSVKVLLEAITYDEEPTDE